MQLGDLNFLELAFYFTLWTSFYFFLCYRNPSRQKEWHCRVVTTTHALIVSSLAIYSTFYLGPSPWIEAGGPNTPCQIHTSCICLGYFLFDLTWCLYHQTEGAVMLAHHLLSILGLTWGLLAGKYGSEIVATIGGAELSNPLLQLRWFIKEMGHYHTVAGDVVDWAFMLFFGFLRIYVGSSLLYSYFLQPTDYVGRFGGLSIYIISWIFFISIVNYAIHKYVKRFRAWRGGRSTEGKGKKDGAETNSLDSLRDKSTTGDVTVIREKEIPTQREIKDRDGELTLRKNCVVTGSL